MIAAFIVLGIRSEHKPCNGWNTFRIPCDDGYMTGVSFGDFGFRKSSEIRESGSPELGDYRYAVVREGVVTAYLALGDPRGAGALMGTGIGVRDVPRPDVWPSSFDSWLYGPAVVVPEKTRVIVRGVNDADR
jgi:hypothetical protein